MFDKSQKIEIIIENTFATSDKNSKELNITVFERVFHKLIFEKSGIGKIIPVYVKSKDNYRILGVFTLNNSGSTSFFPEHLKGVDIFFDHLTLDRDLNKNAHLTHLIKERRKKVSPIALALTNRGFYHLITFVFQDLDQLKLAPEKIMCPKVNFGQKELLKNSLFSKGIFNGSLMLELPEEKGSIIFQILLIPKGIDCNDLSFVKEPLKPIFDDKQLRNFKIRATCLEHKFQDEYKLGVLSFRCSKEIEMPIFLGYSLDKSGFYFNSSDEELNNSMMKRIRKKN
jgi:hypothetical protein